MRRYAHSVGYALSGLRQAWQAEHNGVGDLQWLDGPALRGLEPALAAPAALYSPSSGIVDVHDLMNAYLGDLEDQRRGLEARLLQRAAHIRDEAVAIELTRRHPHKHVGGVPCTMVEGPVVLDKLSPEFPGLICHK